jgi:hypothetical protein
VNPPATYQRKGEIVVRTMDPPFDWISTETLLRAFGTDLAFVHHLKEDGEFWVHIRRETTEKETRITAHCWLPGVPEKPDEPPPGAREYRWPKGNYVDEPRPIEDLMLTEEERRQVRVAIENIGPGLCFTSRNLDLLRKLLTAYEVAVRAKRTARPAFLNPSTNDVDHAALAAAVAAHAPFVHDNVNCPLCGKNARTVRTMPHENREKTITYDGYPVGAFRVCLPCALLVTLRARTDAS